MDKISTIKTQYEQNHYRKQRELINAGKLDYWKLSEKNKKGIMDQCGEEAEKYPELQWVRYFENKHREDIYPDLGKHLLFSYVHIYYRRLDPLPTEEESEVVELKKIKEANQALIAMLDKDLKAKEDEVRKLQDDLNQLEMELSQQTTLAKSTADTSKSRLNQIHELKKELQKLYDTLEDKSILIENYRKEEAALYRDIRTLALR